MKQDNPRYIYITDLELVKCLRSKGYRHIETGFNESTNEQHWKYKDSNELSDVVIPWETEKKLKKYSLDRWIM
ncbi:hypothetical protein [Paenibacillus sp. FSL K6-2524]|uniref:hypothetical protein n=1 Tax=Paenibacillus sp. FSL K6-2524 TaxID=2954516 RepID=UPI0030F701B2